MNLRSKASKILTLLPSLSVRASFSDIIKAKNVLFCIQCSPALFTTNRKFDPNIFDNHVRLSNLVSLIVLSYSCKTLNIVSNNANLLFCIRLPTSSINSGNSSAYFASAAHTSFVEKNCLAVASISICIMPCSKLAIPASTLKASPFMDVNLLDRLASLFRSTVCPKSFIVPASLK